MPKIDTKTAKKIAHSFYDDLNKEMKNEKFKKAFYEERLKLEIAAEILKLRKEKYDKQEKTT